MSANTAPDRWAFESPDAQHAVAERGSFVLHLRERSHGPASDLDAAQLIFGELVANVVRHAPGPIRIEVEWTADRRARLMVRDSGPGFEARFSGPEHPLDESGRGLFIVAALAESIAVDCDATGTTVTAILPVRAVV